MSLPTNSQERKNTPIYSAFLMFFPDAVAEVARASVSGCKQHHEDGSVWWDRSKSGDELDALVRHLMEAGTRDTDGVRHSTKVFWRAGANLQKEIEAERLKESQNTTEET